MLSFDLVGDIFLKGFVKPPYSDNKKRPKASYVSHSPEPYYEGS